MASWVRLGVVTVVGILQAPILFRWVPAGELGVWYLFFALAVFITLSDLGLPSTAGRAVAFLRGLQRSERGAPAPADLPAAYREVSMPELYGSAFLATAGLSVLFAAVAIPAALLYFQLALPPGSVREPLGPALLVFLAGVVLQMVGGLSGACLIGAGELVIDNAIRIATSVTGFLLIWLLVPSHPTLHVLCWIWVAQNALFLLAEHVAASRLLALGPISALRISRKVMWFMLGESLPVFVTRLGTWLVQEMNLLIAGFFLGPALVPDFALVRQVVAIGASLGAAIPIAVSVHISAAHAAGDAPKVRSLYLATLRFSLLFAVLWTVGALAWAPDVLDALVGPGHFVGYAVLVPLAIGSLLEVHATAHGQFLWGIGVWPFARLYVAGGVLNGLLASAGCALFSLGGLAWGALVSQATAVYLAVPRLALRRAGLSAAAFVRSVLAAPAVFGCALAATTFAMKPRIVRTIAALVASDPRVGRIATVLAGVAATVAAAAALAWLVALTGPDREYLLRLARLRRR